MKEKIEDITREQLEFLCKVTGELVTPRETWLCHRIHMIIAHHENDRQQRAPMTPHEVRRWVYSRAKKILKEIDENV